VAIAVACEARRRFVRPEIVSDSWMMNGMRRKRAERPIGRQT